MSDDHSLANRASIVFAKPKCALLIYEPLSQLENSQVLIKVSHSAISPGSESLFYQGVFPQDGQTDANIKSLQNQNLKISTIESEQTTTNTLSKLLNSNTNPFPMYPIRYGYCCVGKCIKFGPKVSESVKMSLLDRFVFVFHPHSSYAVVDAKDCLLIPQDIDPISALFYPNMESSINFVHDGSPLLGESCSIVGCGILGTLTKHLLQYSQLSTLSIDLDSERAKNILISEPFKVVKPNKQSIPFLPTNETETKRRTRGPHAQSPIPKDAIYPLDMSYSISNKALFIKCKNNNKIYISQINNFDIKRLIEIYPSDVTFELSGSPHGINSACHVANDNSTIILGSWYGKKTWPNLSFGDARIHRSKIQIKFSQVSFIQPHLTGRWTKQRRSELVWHMIRKINPKRFISKVFEIPGSKKSLGIDSEMSKSVNSLYESTLVPSSGLQSIFTYE